MWNYFVSVVIVAVFVLLPYKLISIFADLITCGT